MLCSPIGNRTKYFYDAANALTVKGDTAAFANPSYFGYDRNGSLLRQQDTSTGEPGGAGTTYFEYNPAGMVDSIIWKDESVTQFYYDGNLQRYAMREGAPGSQTATYFLWDGPNILQELATDGSVIEQHTNAITPIAGIGQLVQTYRPNEAAADQKIYPVQDQRGTIQRWVKDDGTTVMASREYDAFGTLIPNSETGTWPSRFGYQGQAWIEIYSADENQRLLLSPARIYLPEEGVFASRDIARDRLNLYPYLHSGHLNHVDPMGSDERPLEATVRMVESVPNPLLGGSLLQGAIRGIVLQRNLTRDNQYGTFSIRVGSLLHEKLPGDDKFYFWGAYKTMTFTPKHPVCCTSIQGLQMHRRSVFRNLVNGSKRVYDYPDPKAYKFEGRTTLGGNAHSLGPSEVEPGWAIDAARSGSPWATKQLSAGIGKPDPSGVGYISEPLVTEDVPGYSSKPGLRPHRDIHAIYKDSEWEWETCAFCNEDLDKGKIYGCFRWGFSIIGPQPKDFIVALHPLQFSNSPSASFSAAIGAWNRQAADPEKHDGFKNQQRIESGRKVR